MKRQIKQIFALALILCLLGSLGVTAFADNNISVNAVQGQALRFSQNTEGTISSVQFIGDCPGVAVSSGSKSFGLSGTPTTAGGYTIKAVVSYESGGSDTYNIVIRVSESGSADPGSGGGTITPSEGESANIVNDDGTITPAKPDPGAPIKVTKSPTGESVNEGEGASFVARAENAATFSWGLYNPTTDEYLTAKQAPGHFAGLGVEILGDATDTTLVLTSIPGALNGWYAEARFYREGADTAFSNGARITVIGATPQTPTITEQPQGAQMQYGKTASLYVKAVAAGSNTLKYQWYRSDTNKNSGGTAISGATSNTYTPPETSGVSYYYVNVWATDGTKESTHVNSSVAAVQYPAAPAATATPAPAGNGGAGTAGTNVTPGSSQAGTSQPTSSPAPSAGPENSSDRNAQAVVTTAEPEAEPVQRSHGTLVLLILILLAALITACVIYLYLRRSYKE